MSIFLGFLKSLFVGIVDLILGQRKSTAEKLGQAEETSSVLQKEVNTLNAEAQAKADAPTNLQEVIAEQKNGEI